MLVDAFSNFVYFTLVPGKKGEHVAKAMDKLLSRTYKTKEMRSLQTDKEHEFFNKHVSTVLCKHNVDLYSTFSMQKAFLAEQKKRDSKLYINRLRNVGLLTKQNYEDKFAEIITKINQSKDSRSGKSPAQLNLGIS